MEKRVILSAFGDEGANSRAPREQLAVLAALGLHYYSLRNVQFGPVPQHFTTLSSAQVAELTELHAEYGMSVAELGTAIGKTKIVEEEDGTANKFVSDAECLRQLDHVIELCGKFGTKMIRAFTFYHPKGKKAADYVSASVDRLAPLAERARAAGVVLGLEIEANLIGEDGATLASICRQLKNDHVVTIWDGANIACRNLGRDDCLGHFAAMADTVGWMHAKDYQIQTGLPWAGHVDEERLKHFVPVGRGDSAYPNVFSHVRSNFATYADRAERLGLPGFVITLEPHLKGGGQFGGFSGPDGMGVALRALDSMLQECGFRTSLRCMNDVLESRES
ncbi:MAG: TIM barrel protein [Bdellovibrionota bacterium]